MQNTYCRCFYFIGLTLHYIIFRKYSQEQKKESLLFASSMPTRTSELLHAVPEWVEITHHKQPLNSQNENKYWNNNRKKELFRYEFEWKTEPQQKTTRKKTVSVQEKSAAFDVEMNKKIMNKRQTPNISSLALRALCLCVFITLFFSLSSIEYFIRPITILNHLLLKSGHLFYTCLWATIGNNTRRCMQTCTMFQYTGMVIFFPQP